MAVTGMNKDLPTLLDWAKLREPDGSYAAVVELLEKRSPAIRSAVFVEGNLPTGHQFTSRTALPSIGWRRFNEGYHRSKGRTAQITETCGMMVGKAAVDKDIVSLYGSLEQARLSESKGFMQAFVQEAEYGLWYHSTKTSPEKFMGLTPRLDSTTAVYGDQIVLANPNASGNANTSMWFVTWSPDTVFGIYPKGSVAGLEAIDMGLQYVDDGTGKEFLAYCQDWTWKLGFCVKDARYLVRIANIDETAMNPANDTLVPAMIRAYARLQNPSLGRTVIYCNREVWTALWLQARKQTERTLTIDNPEGKPVVSFMGIPIEITDGLGTAEAAVS